MNMKGDLKLSYRPLCPCSQLVRIVLREKGLQVEEEVVLTKTSNSEVPKLTHKGFEVFGSLSIVEYLEEVFPARSLLPKVF